MNVAAIDLGGHTISFAIVREHGGELSISSRINCGTPDGRDIGRVVSCLAENTLALSEKSRIEAVCIAVPGFLDKTRRRILKFTNFAGLEDVEFAEMLERELSAGGLDAPVYMENDANCAALGEKSRGLAKDMSDCVVLTLGTGIGCGIISNGLLVTGAHGLASEAGHIVVSPAGKACGCGGVGHLESETSADWIEKKAGSVGLPSDFKALWARRGEKEAFAILEPALDALARGVASLAVTTDPEAFILSGGMSLADGIADEIKERAYKYLPIPFRGYLEIYISGLGPDAALYGAASIGYNTRGSR